MKTQILSKAKWYVLGVIVVVLTLSVALSYCAWDNFSYRAKANGSSGAYSDRTVELVEDKDNNGIVSVGDIVNFGKFYQETDAITTHKLDPLRWIVVDIDATGIASLLTEQAVVLGNFWGDVVNQQSYNVNYYHSTVRSWLNSGKGSLVGDASNWSDSARYNDNIRNDGVGSAFGINQPNQVNKGFLDVVFSDVEKKIMVPKRIDNLKTVYADGRVVEKTTDGRTFINDLVWLPSLSELYGNSNYEASSAYEGTPKKQLSYFNNSIINQKNLRLICSATDYAFNASKTSYFNNGQGVTDGFSQNAVQWYTRNSDWTPADRNDAISIDSFGGQSWRYAYMSSVGVRPGVCVRI